jgi:hypothetical protein
MESSSASRVYSLFRKLEAAQTKGSNGIAAWAEVFQLRDTNDRPTARARTEDRISALLSEVRDEIHAIEERYFDAVHDDQAQAVARTLIQQAMEVTASRNLGNDAKALFANYLPPHVLMGWAAWAVAMPREDDGVTEEQLAAFRAALDELSEAAQAEGVPPRVRAFAQRQAQTLRDALRLYPIRGAVVVGKTALRGATELVQESDDLREELNTGDEPGPVKRVLSGLGKAWANGAKFGDQVDKLYRLYEHGRAALGHAAPALESAKESISALLDSTSVT